MYGDGALAPREGVSARPFRYDLLSEAGILGNDGLVSGSSSGSTRGLPCGMP
jgi:hypothetical protein